MKIEIRGKNRNERKEEEVKFDLINVLCQEMRGKRHEKRKENRKPKRNRETGGEGHTESDIRVGEEKGRREREGGRKRG